MPSSIAISFLSALQASVSVLITVGFGALGFRWGLIDERSATEIGKTCVKLFLPALMATNLGGELHLSTVMRYVPIFIWAIAYNLISLALGVVSTRIFDLPEWVTPAITFNNTTSLPLLLVQALEATGILKGLLMSADDTTSAAVERAKSYFLVSSMVSNVLTFAIGPRLLSEYSEHPGDKPNDEEFEGTDAGDGSSIGSDVDPDENTSLLPDPVVRSGKRTARKGRDYFAALPPWMQTTLSVAYSFCNAPLLGAAVGTLIGLVPALHRAFFAETFDGGIFNAWLTKGVQNVGDLFASLQAVAVGVKLAAAHARARKGEASGHVPWKSMAFVTAVRFVVWPAIAVPLFWALAGKTNILGNDPVQWFCLMLMAAGPSAMQIAALADVKGCGEGEKLSIARFLTMSYAISPLICLGVVGSLKAAEAAKSG
ncbi:hypothetical protein EJ06DRAFT_529380 [Trichodelitschia bisporula]|uniref:Auxin efflux carrier n=1 Tax=Trichodelitschia bisporula TaxID=703511 RepID=A0A6G1HYX5_9PEZI|nr:hypothetical protein EJ06DRAFT_529380 [Trichodelitschia bisporula]